MAWFQEAKLGIFIHWGIYAVNGVAGSWSFFNEQLSFEDYMTQLDGFTAANFDAFAWAELFARAGAKYAVLTAKHHDGVALYDTREDGLTVLQDTPAGRDLVAEFVAAVRWKELRVGLYFSHLDWSHPDYSPVSPGCTARLMQNGRIYATWTEGPYNPSWQRFLAFHRAQIRELCHNYAPDLLWFDGDWTPGSNWWDFERLRDEIEEWNPGTLVNSRIGRFGDYETPEQGIPILTPRKPWEVSVTMNDSLGYQPQDKNYKSVRQIVRMLAECIGMGGNLLLGVGPQADGTIVPEQADRLEGLGQWTSKHAEAIYPTFAGLPHGHHYGASTLSKDGQTLYLFCFDRPADQRNSVGVRGIQNTVNRVSVVGSGKKLSFRKIGGAPGNTIPGILWIDLPPSALDAHCTVLKVELDGALDLYRGEGQVISRN